MLMSEYTVQFAARNEVVSYRGSEGLFHFNVGLVGKEWLVTLPPLVGPRGEPRFLTASEAAAVLPRVKTFLSRIWWLGVWPASYQVSFVGEAVTPNPLFQPTAFGGG